MGHKKQGMDHKKLRKIVEQNGWRIARHHGDHQIFKHPTKKGIVVIPHNRDISKNVELSALRQAGLRK